MHLLAKISTQCIQTVFMRTLLALAMLVQESIKQSNMTLPPAALTLPESLQEEIPFWQQALHFAIKG